MTMTLGEIASALGAEVLGDAQLQIARPAEPSEAGPNDLALAMNPAWADSLKQSAAQAAVVWHGADWQALGLKGAIVVDRPRLAMARLTQAMDTPVSAHDVHKTAIIDGASLGSGVSIGAYSVIEPGAIIGAGSQIGSHVTIAGSVKLGANCTIMDGVRIRRHVQIGAQAMIHCNAVIGDDGFSFVTAKESNVERARAHLGDAEITTPEDATWIRIHSLGGVVIGDNVEIGSATAIDAGTIRPTRVGNGCKFDNFCHIGHNVVIGDDCLLAGFGAVAGSTQLGDRVVMGGQGGIADNLTIGNDVVITGGTKVLSNVASGKVMMGYPAVEIKTHVDMYKALRRLPRWMAKSSKSSETP